MGMKSIQELQQMIESLEKRMAELEAKVKNQTDDLWQQLRKQQQHYQAPL